MASGVVFSAAGFWAERNNRIFRESRGILLRYGL